MNVLEALYNEIYNIQNDLLAGSSEIALKALEVVSAIIDLNQFEDENYAKIVADLLKKSKPSMAAVEVICNYAINQYAKNKTKGNKYFYTDVRNKMMRAKENTIMRAFHKLFDNNSKNYINIATCSFSSNVINLLRFADSHNKNIRLFIIQSLNNNIDYSQNLTNQFHNTGILTKIISIEEFRKIKDEINYSIIGADGFDFDNNVINGFPSKEFAEASFGRNNFYVVAESFKKIDNLKLDNGFELISSKYISGIISDDERWIYKEELQVKEKIHQSSQAV